MKFLATMIIGFTVAGSSVPTLAAGSDAQSLAQCTTELQRTLGPQTRVKMRSLAHRSSGALLRLKALPADGESLMVTCRAARDGSVELLDKHGVALLARHTQGADKVTLND